MSSGLPLAAALAVIAFSAPARAQDDPPARVGRVAAFDGSVMLFDPDSNQWTSVDRNYPFAAGQSWWVDGAPALMEVGGMWLDLAPGTELNVGRLDYGVSEFDVTTGEVELRIWSLPRGGVTVTTPGGAVHIEEAGLYRIGVYTQDGNAPQTQLVVFDGKADLPDMAGDPELMGGQAGQLTPQGLLVERPAADELDDWARNAEQGYNPALENDVGVDFTGYDELASAGEWFDTPDYGRVWTPNDVPTDWAPYRYGHWINVAPWGWTWIDDAPWGFAPFHYGRWTRVDGRWCWVPGQGGAGQGGTGHPHPEPVYAPALVAFVGGHGTGVSLTAGGGTAWVPLAPNEVYRPSYHTSVTYVRQVNVSNVNETVINQTIVNNQVVPPHNPGEPGGAPSWRNGVAMTMSSQTTVAPHQVVHAPPVSGPAAPPPHNGMRPAPPPPAYHPVAPHPLAPRPMPAPRPTPTPQTPPPATTPYGGHPHVTPPATTPAPHQTEATKVAPVDKPKDDDRGDKKRDDNG